MVLHIVDNFSMQNKRVLANRLPTTSQKRYANYNLNLEIEEVLPVVCGRP